VKRTQGLRPGLVCFAPTGLRFRIDDAREA